MQNQKGRIERLAKAVYSELSGAERFRLVTTLTGEGNREEAITVAEACPRLSYLMADKDYGERCMGAWKMVREADALIEKYRVAMELLDAQAIHTILRVLKMGESEKMDGSGARGDNVPDDAPPWIQAAKRMKSVEPVLESVVQPLLKGLLSPIAIGLKCEWTGFDNCCRDHLGIDGKTLLSAWGRASCLDWLENLEPAVKAVEVDEEAGEAMEAAEEGFRAMLRFT